jgi:hypothetical protein
MDKLIAVCGLDCAQCPAFIASRTNDDDLRKKTAAEWKQSYNFDFTPEMINCHGCLSTDGVQIGHCAVCEMRTCALSKNAKSCAHCAEYPCKTITGFHAMCPEAAQNLKDYTRASS